MKGCLASLSLGFEILLSALNIIIGLAVLVLGIVIVAGKVEVIMGLLALGIACIVAGFVLLVAGLLSMMGSCSETPTAVKASYYASTLALLLATALAITAYTQTRDVPATSRTTWAQLDEGERMTAEETLGCCGLSTVTEMATSKCQSEVPCLPLLEALLSSRILILAMVCGVAAGIQLGAIFCGCCVYRKMKKQQKKRRKKEDKRAMEEGAKQARKKDHRLQRMDKFRKEAGVI
jgi:hypothetical protein